MNNGIPIGAVMTFATPKAPDGWLVCDGSEFTVAQYKYLFDAIGYIYGGDGVSTFCVPDLQGMFIRGLDLDGVVDPERELGSFQEDSFQGHEHLIDSIEIESSGSHQHKVRVNEFEESHDVGKTVLRANTNVHYYGVSYEAVIDTTGEHNHIVPQHQSNGFLNSKFGTVRVTKETRPKNVALLYCIKAF